MWIEWLLFYTLMLYFNILYFNAPRTQWEYFWTQSITAVRIQVVQVLLAITQRYEQCICSLSSIYTFNSYILFHRNKLYLVREGRSSLVAQTVKNLPAAQEAWVRSLGREDPLEEGLAAHSSILAWRIPGTEEPGGLQSTGSQRVRHDWATKHKRRNCLIFYSSQAFYSHI